MSARLKGRVRAVYDDPVDVVKKRKYIILTQKGAKLSAGVRAKLNRAVKLGVLGHRKKDGEKPEMYFDTNVEHHMDEVMRRYLNYLENEKFRGVL